MSLVRDSVFYAQGVTKGEKGLCVTRNSTHKERKKERKACASQSKLRTNKFRIKEADVRSQTAGIYKVVEKGRGSSKI